MKYKSIIFLVLGLIIAYIVFRFEGFHIWINSLAGYGYFGSLIAGIFFVSTFTAATAILVLVYLGQNLNPVLVALIAGAGSVIGDYIIFKFIKFNIKEDLDSIVDKIPLVKKIHATKIFKNKYASWFLPFFGAIIIASPFPDEIGISLMGLSSIQTKKFLLISFLLNSTGILILIILTKLS